jgi:hypothetical protein
MKFIFKSSTMCYVIHSRGLRTNNYFEGEISLKRRKKRDGFTYRMIIYTHYMRAPLENTTITKNEIPLHKKTTQITNTSLYSPQNRG